MDKAIILAAGEGTRMKSRISKVMHKIVNKSLLEYVLEASVEAGIDENIVIVGKNEDVVKEYFGDSLIYRRQNIGKDFPYGTGYAVMQAVDLIEDGDSIAILSGDVPLIRPETLKDLMDFHNKSGNDATVLTADIDDPSGYGRILKDEEGKFLRIVEDRDCTEEEKKIKEFNSGIYVFNGGRLKDALKKLDMDNSQGELYVTDVFSILRQEEGQIDTFKLKDLEEVYGINSKVQLAEAEEIMRKRINTRYMEEGVILENPSSITIEKGVVIGQDTKIEANVRILGKTEIGRDCLIGANSQVEDSILGDEVIIKSSFVEKSSVGDYTDIGPFAHIRPNSKLGRQVHIGNFVEIKNASLGDYTKAGHLAYVGDADLGSKINVGCGVIFVNYDGKNKFRSKVEDGAFVGSNANIVAPVHIDREAYVAAGSTITRDVEAGALAVERARQKNIAGYVERKKEKEKNK